MKLTRSYAEQVRRPLLDFAAASKQEAAASKQELMEIFDNLIPEEAPCAEPWDDNIEMKMDAFRSAMRLLSYQVFGRDADGDCQVDFSVWDCKKGSPPRVVPISNDYNYDNQEERLQKSLDRLDDAYYNLRRTQSDFDSQYRVFQDIRREEHANQSAG